MWEDMQPEWIIMPSKMNTQKHRQNDEKSAAKGNSHVDAVREAKKLPKNTAVLGAKTACKNRAKLRVSVAMANISML
mgnify:CR=1 FL=1